MAAVLLLLPFCAVKAQRRGERAGALQTLAGLEGGRVELPNGWSLTPVGQVPGSASTGRRLIFWPPNFSAVRRSGPKSSRSMPRTRWYQAAAISTSFTFSTMWSMRSMVKRIAGRLPDLPGSK